MAPQGLPRTIPPVPQPSPAAPLLHLPALIQRYAARLHAQATYEHHIISPLSAWMLLALTGASAPTSSRGVIEEALGCPAEAALAHTDLLLRLPHPALINALGVWCAPHAQTEPLLQWQRSLPPTVERGPLPPREQADAWTRSRTRGLIERFPASIPLATLEILASAVATTASWDEGFLLEDVEALGESPWEYRVDRVLRSAAGHRVGVISHPRAGWCGVHVVRGANLEVCSVIARPDIAPAEVRAAAHEIAVAHAQRRLPLPRLAELPLGEGPAWELWEEPGEEGAEHTSAVLPAWEASSSHDLQRDPSLGFAGALEALATMHPHGLSGSSITIQAVTARMSRDGFEATAGASRILPTPAQRGGIGKARALEVRFARPHAVVAVTADEAGASRTGAWHGLPVLSAWVSEPADADALILRGPTPAR